METSNETVYLEQMDHSIHKLVNIFIREMDSETALQTEIQQKFKEYEGRCGKGFPACDPNGPDNTCKTMS